MGVFLATDRERQSSRGHPPQERIYENAEYHDIESPPRYLDEGNSYEEAPAESNGGHRNASSKMRLMTGNGAPAAPSSAPPKSLLEAAVGRPTTQRGLDPQHGQGQGQSSRHTNQSSGSTSRRYEYDQDGDEEGLHATAIDIHPHGRGQFGNNQQYQAGAPALSLDELV
jgi:hypothetical protein